MSNKRLKCFTYTGVPERFKVTHAYDHAFNVHYSILAFTIL